MKTHVLLLAVAFIALGASTSRAAAAKCGDDNCVECKNNKCTKVSVPS